MRFMMIVKASKNSEAGMLPTDELLNAMGKYNEELMKAGVLIDLAGLQSSANGVRARYSKGKQTLIDGPFAETKELIAGYWLIKVKSREEAIEWLERVPAPHGDEVDGEVELRQVFELEDFLSCEALKHQREVEKELASRK